MPVEEVGVGVAEGAARRVVALARRRRERLDGREEQGEVQRLVREDLGHGHADVDLRGEARPQGRLVHPRQALVPQVERRLDDAVDAGVAALDLLVGEAK